MQRCKGLFSVRRCGSDRLGTECDRINEYYYIELTGNFKIIWVEKDHIAE